VTLSHVGCGCAGTVRALNRVEMIVERQAAVPEFAAMLRMEDRLNRGALGEWTERSNASISRMLNAAPTTLTPTFLESVPRRLISGFGRGWPSRDLAGLMSDVVEETYKLSAQVILRKHEGARGYQRNLVFKQGNPAVAVPNFDLIDEEAVAYLADSQVFWLREHFDTDTVEAIRAAGWADLAGQSGASAGEALRRLAERQFGVGAFDAFGDAYFEGTAVNAGTTARVTGAMFELRDIEATQYIVVAVLDERTTEICTHLDGKVFSVTQAAERMDEIIASGTPQGIRDLHPWRPNTFREDLRAIGVDIQPGVALSESAAAVAVAAGFGFPPYHFKCRTTVDIA